MILALLVMASGARAELSLCNHTSWWLEAAVIHDRENTVHSILPGECKIFIPSPLGISSKYFIAAAIKNVYQKNDEWKLEADHGLCVNSGRYIFFRIGDSQPCKNERRSLLDYLLVNVDSGRFVYGFYEDRVLSLEEARIAGAQRFLIAEGFDAGPVDGINGPLTKRALAGYERRYGLGDDGLVTSELIEAMTELRSAAARSMALEIQSPRQ